MGDLDSVPSEAWVVEAMEVEKEDKGFVAVAPVCAVAPVLCTYIACEPVVVWLCECACVYACVCVCMVMTGDQLARLSVCFSVPNRSARKVVENMTKVRFNILTVH